MVALRPATATTSATERSAPAIAAKGRAQDRAPTRPEIDHEHGPESRRLRRAEDRRVGERIAQQALQRRARKAEHPADHESQQRARQADFPHHDARRRPDPTRAP